MLNQSRSWIAQAVKRILRPLVRLLIAHDLTLPWLVNLLKEMYVDVAATDLRGDGEKEPAHSRVSLLTGVHRKDVKRILESEDEDGAMPENRIDLMLGLWMGSEAFLDEHGSPRPLARAAARREGEPASFEDLADSVSRKDINAGTILKELLDQKLVSLDGALRVVLNVDALVPDNDLEGNAFYLGQNEGDHLAAGVHNMLASGEPKFLDRAVYYEGLSEVDVLELEQMARDESIELLKRLNREAHARAKQRSGSHRFNYGTYFYHAKVDEEADGDAESR